MSVHLLLSCGGCDATTKVGPLRKRFHGSNGCWGWGVALVDTPESLTPDGWVMFDPYTYCTYCPTCWASIETPERKDPDGLPPSPYADSVAAALADARRDPDAAADAFLRSRCPGPATHAGRIAAAGVPVTAEDFDVRRDG